MNSEEVEQALKFGSLWNNFMNKEANPEDYSTFYQVTKANKEKQFMEVLCVATKLSDVNNVFIKNCHICQHVALNLPLSSL